MHGDVCDNCGLRRPEPGQITPEKYLTLSEIDVRCEAGPVDHHHPAEEKRKRVDAFFNQRRS